MKLLFENKFSNRPLVSIVLLDWSVRESYHVLYYLNNQTVPREQYEIIWIEYYNSHPKEIEEKIRESTVSGKLPAIDKWIVMEMPPNVYHHKHLMYNIGIITSSGCIVTFMDSDAVAKPTFVESLIRSFEKNRNIVLHMDQIRNISRRFYPFNYPSIDEIDGEGCVNLLNGRPRGLIDKSDPMQFRNYGACMSAMRDDLIFIGGADEHIEYLGHICGPYDMTFRLVNAGKKEIWHPDEWLYHVWHPGQDGVNNFAGPHDGRHISKMALRSRKHKRIMPLKENPAIRLLRLKECTPKLEEAIIWDEIEKWTIDNWQVRPKKLLFSKNTLVTRKEADQYRLDFITNMRIKRILFKMTFKKLMTILKENLEKLKGSSIKTSNVEVGKKQTGEYIKNLFIKFKGFIVFLQEAGIYNKYVVDECVDTLQMLASKNIKEVAIFGIDSIAEILYTLSSCQSVNIIGFFDVTGRKRFHSIEVRPLSNLKGYKGEVIIASFTDIEEKAEALREIGINNEKIILPL